MLSFSTGTHVKLSSEPEYKVKDQLLCLSEDNHRSPNLLKPKPPTVSSSMGKCPYGSNPTQTEHL